MELMTYGTGELFATALEAIKRMCSYEADFPQATSPDGLIGDRGPTLHGLISLAAHLAMKVPLTLPTT